MAEKNRMMINNHKNWRLIFTPDQGPYLNMAIDEALVSKYTNNEDNGMPTIRLYTWKVPSCTIGYFQRIKNVLATLEDKNMPIVRRPTGGGTVFHGNDITYSIIKRTNRNNRLDDVTTFYEIIGKSIFRTLEKLGFECAFYKPENDIPVSKSIPMLSIIQDNKYVDNKLQKYDNKLETYPTKSPVCSLTPEKYDIMINGNKVAGYAARRMQGIILCQGYLNISEIPKNKNNVGPNHKMIGPLFNNLVNGFEEIFGIKCKREDLTKEEMNLAYQIEERKYAGKDWNYRK